MKKHILIVDDEPSIRDICKDILEDEGYRITVAVDGQDAVDKMDYFDFDLFLVDMSMPRISGLELMRVIKNKQPFAVIIILTGFASVHGAVKAIHEGAFHYIAKPTDPDELIYVVKRGIKYSEDLYGPLQNAFEPGSDNEFKRKPIILNGFSQKERDDFLELGSLRKYGLGIHIPISEETAGSIILIEEGEVSVWLNNTIIDYLEKMDSFGEETLILKQPAITKLRAETSVNIRHFDRQKLLDFFSYKGDRLFKRFMINLINNSFYKWRKSVQRIVMLKLSTGEK